jgi:hypothetical protein
MAEEKNIKVHHTTDLVKIDKVSLPASLILRRNLLV